MLIDTVLLSMKNLGRKKSRSLLTVMGIAIGVASVVLIASIGDIGKYTINQELDSLGVGGIMISGNKKIPGASLDNRHLEAIRQSGAVDSAIPIVVDYTKSYMRGLMLDTVVWGIDYGANQVIALDTLYGRLITKNDVLADKRVCVVDQNIAQAYYRRDNIVGKTMTLQFATGYEEFQVVGVVASGGSLMQGMMGSLIPSFIYLPYSTMQALSGKDSFDQIAIKIKDSIDPEVAGAQLISISNGVSGVSSGFKAENMQSQKNKLNGVLDIITVVLAAIAGVSLIVAGLSIMTVMLVSVNERTREIGIKKSIGANKKNIMWEFLIEAFTISLLGSLAGTAIGILLLVVGCLPFGIPVRFNVELIIFCIIFSVLIGVVFGVYPATIASKLRPVDALRCE